MNLPKIKDKTQVFAMTAGLLLVIYGWTAAPFITLMDAGDLATGTLSLGIAHPPGYPLFTILGFIAGKLLWFLEPMYRINLMNAAFGAIACGLLSVIVYTLVPRKVLAVFAGLSLAFTSICWTLAATAEVYSLNLLLSNALWLLALKMRSSFTSKKWWLFCLVFGLSLANCYPLILLMGLGLIFIVPRQVYEIKTLWKGAVCVLVGLLPYFYLVIQSQRNGTIEFNIYGLYGYENILPYILRTSYAALDQKSSTFADKWFVLFILLYNIVKDFSLSSLFVGAGLYAAFRYKMKYRWPLAISGFATSILLYLLLGTTVQYDQFFQFYEYILPTLAVLAIFAVLGIHWLSEKYRLGDRFVGCLCSLALLSQIAISYPISNHHGNSSVDAWAQTVMNSLPKNSSLLLCGDEFAFVYLKNIKGVRPDLHLLVSYLDQGVLHFYQRNIVGEKASERRLSMDDILKEPASPVYTTECGPLYIRDGYTVALKGLTYQIVSKDSPELPGMVLTRESLRNTLDSIMLGPAEADYWMKKLRLRSASLLLTYATHEKVITPDQLEQFIQLYQLNTEVNFIASIASEFAYRNDFKLATLFFQRIKVEDFANIKVDDAAVYCRMLLSNGDTVNAQSVCYIADQSFRECDPDSKYNLGRAFWANKPLALKFLGEAVACDPKSQALKDLLKKREDAPAGIF